MKAVGMKKLVYSLIMIVVIGFVSSGADWLVQLHNNTQTQKQIQQMIDTNNRKFCLVVSPAIAVPVPKPTDPAKDPSRERTYQWYQRYIHLNHNLGCDRRAPLSHGRRAHRSLRLDESSLHQDGGTRNLSILKG
jgi:hypothetical protein